MALMSDTDADPGPNPPPRSTKQQFDAESNNPPPPPQKAEEDLDFGDYVSDVGRGLGHGMVEGTLNVYDTVREGAEWAAEGLTGEELFDVEETENTFNAPTTLPGQIASGIGQFVPGLAPGLGVANATITGAKIGLNAIRMLSRTSASLFNSPKVTNLTGNLINIGTRQPKLAAALKGMTVGAAAEQFAFDTTDERISNYIEDATEITVVSYLASLLAQEDDDSEAMARTRMFMEGMLLGGVFEVALMGVRGAWVGVTKKPVDDAGTTPLTQEDIADMNIPSGRPLNPGEPGDAAFLNTAIYNTLKENGFDDSYIQKYVGSINTMHLASSKYETYNLIKETGDALELQAINKGQDWPKTISNKETLQEAATLLGHDSIDAMNAALSQTEGMLKLTKDPKKGVVIGPGLQGLTSYAVAARQLLMNTNDLVFTLAKEAATHKPKYETVLGKKGKLIAGDVQKYEQTKAAFMQQVLIYQNVQDTVNNIAGEAGRLLQSFNINVGDGIKPSFIGDVINSAGTNLDDVLTSIAAKSDELAARGSKSGRNEPPSATEKYNAIFGNAENKSLLEKTTSGIGEYWYNAILSAPDTQMVNILGNVVVQVARTALEGTIGATRGTLKLATSKLTGQEIDPGSVMLFGDVWARVKGMSYGKSRAGSVSKVALAGNMDNPIVLDKMIYDVSVGKYGKGRTIEEVINDVGFEQVYNRTKDTIVDQQAASVMNFVKASQLFGQAVRHELPTEARYSKFELAEAASGRTLPGVIGRVVRTPTTLMGAFDTAFKAIADNAALYEAAYRELRSMKYRAKKSKTGEIALPDGKIVKYNEGNFTLPGERGGDTTFTAAEYIEHLVANPTKSMDDYARKEFLQSTFQQDNAFTKSGDAVRNFLNFRVKGVPVPVGTMLMPFVRTPINLMAYSLDRTPLGFLSPEYSKAKEVVRRLKDKPNPTVSNQRSLRDAQIEIEKTYNKQIAGMGYLGMAAAASSAGYITGGGPSNYAERNRLEGTGWKPYSVKIDGKYYPIGRLDPFSQLAALGSDLLRLSTDLAEANLSKEDRKEADTRLYYIMNSLTSNMTQMITDKTYLKSIGDIVRTFTSQTGSADGEFDVIGKALKATGKVAGGVVGGLVPNIVSRMGEAFRDEEKGITYFYDDMLRSTAADVTVFRAMFLSATGKVPGLRESITDAGMVAKYHPRYNQFGQVILRNKMPFDRDDFMGKASNAMFTITRPGGSPMTDEEKEMVYIEQKYKASVLRVNRKLSPYGAGGETVELSPLLYDLLSQYQGNYYRRHLIELRKKPDFIRVFNEAESGSNTSTKKVRDIISAIQSDARSAGTVLLQREHSDLIKELLKERGTSVRKLLVDSLTLSHDPAGKRMLEGWKEEQRGSN
jgi:hypothetical protein